MKCFALNRSLKLSLELRFQRRNDVAPLDSQPETLVLAEFHAVHDLQPHGYLSDGHERGVAGYISRRAAFYTVMEWGAGRILNISQA